MSWWDTDNGDDVIGDQAADLIRHSLQQAATEKVKRAHEKPSLSDILRAVGGVAATDNKRHLNDVPADLIEIIAVLDSGGTISSGPLGDSTPDDLVSVFRENLAAIHNVYQERWERKPRMTEWLSALEFVLRYRPEEFLSDGVEHSPSRLEVKAGSHS